MENPKAANLMTPDEVKALGWPAEARDEDGHLMSMSSLCSDTELKRYIQESGAEGWTVTIFPPNEISAAQRKEPAAGISGE